MLEIAPKAVSSTEIRRRVAAGESTSELVSPAVAAYLRDHALFQVAQGGGFASDLVPGSGFMDRPS